GLGDPRPALSDSLAHAGSGDRAGRQPGDRRSAPRRREPGTTNVAGPGPASQALAPRSRAARTRDAGDLLPDARTGPPIVSDHASRGGPARVGVTRSARRLDADRPLRASRCVAAGRDASAAPARGRLGAVAGL